MKQKTILVNKGISGQGKSATIRLIYEDLINLHGAIATTIIQPILPTNKDIKVVVDLNGIKIGIESQGDPHSRLFSSISEFANVPCDIIICACRTGGSTVKAVDSIVQNFHYRKIYFSNYRSSSNIKNDLNVLSSQHACALVLEIMNGKI